MSTRAKLSDAPSLDAANTLRPSPMMRPNHSRAMSESQGAGSDTNNAAPASASVVPPAVSESEEKAEEDKEGATAAASASASSSSRARVADASCRTPRDTPEGHRKTFLQLFGLDALNTVLSTELGEQQKQAVAEGRRWTPLPWEIPNPATTTTTTAVTAAGDATVQLSSAQEAKWHFRTHALSPFAAKRKRIRREILLTQQHQLTPETTLPEDHRDDVPSLEEIALRSMSFGRRIELAHSQHARSARSGGGGDVSSRSARRPSRLLCPTLSQHASPRSLAEMTLGEYRDFLARDQAAFEAELRTLTAEGLQQKLREEERAQQEAEEEIQEEEEGDDSSEASTEEGDDDDIDIHSHSPHRRARLPGSSPQHYFLSHGHQHLYADFGTPHPTRLEHSTPKPPHSALAEKMQSRTSKSMNGMRFDSIWSLERESERKWLLAQIRRAHIQNALNAVQQMDSTSAATATLPGIIAATQRLVEPRPESAAETTLAAPPASARTQRSSSPPSHRRSDSAPVDFYPPSSSLHLGLSAKGSQILTAQLPHFASLVVAAEERMDSYGEDSLPSVAEQSLAVAAASASGSVATAVAAAAPRRRIQGAPAFLPRPPPIRASVLDDPEVAEKVANPEPALSVFRVSKRGVQQSARIIESYSSSDAKASRAKRNTSSEFGVQPDTPTDGAAPAIASLESRPTTAVDITTAAIDSASFVPFADTDRYPPQRYPPSAPTLAAVCARDPPVGDVGQPRPFQPHIPISFRDRIHITKHSALKASDSIFPDASLANQPLPYNIHEAPTIANQLRQQQAAEPELVHIRPWAPPKDLHSSQLSHCVPRPPASALTGATVAARFIPPAPRVRAGSATARARTSSRNASLSGSSTARTSRATSARIQRDKSPAQMLLPALAAALDSSREVEHTTPHGVPPIDLALAFAGHQKTRAVASSTPLPATPQRAPNAHVASSPSSPLPPRSPSLLTPPRSPLSSAPRTPTRSPRHSALTVDTLSLPLSLPGPALAEAMSMQQAQELVDTISGWTVAQSPTTPTSATPRVAIKSTRRTSRRRRSSNTATATTTTKMSPPTSPRRHGSAANSASPRRRSTATKSLLSPKRAAAKRLTADQPASPSAQRPSHINTAISNDEPSASSAITILPSDALSDEKNAAGTSSLSSSQRSTSQSVHSDPASASQRRSGRRQSGRPSRNGHLGADEFSDESSGGEQGDHLSPPRVSPPRTIATAATDVLASHLFKPSLNFRSERSRSMSVSKAPSSAAERMQQAQSGRRSQVKLGVFEEATLRRHEPSTRWQLIDQLFENQRVDLHRVQQLQLTRVTSEMQLLDHLGRTLPEGSVAGIIKPEVVLPLRRVHGPDSASDESDPDELAQLTPEEKKARWAARVAKQERRVQEAHEEAERRVHEALDDEELEAEAGSGVAEDLSRRRQEHLVRIGSLSQEDKAVADNMDLEAEARALQERITQLADSESPYAPRSPDHKNTAIQQANKALRKAELDLKLRESYRDMTAQTPQQRRAAAFHAMDEQQSWNGAQPVSASNANTNTLSVEPDAHARKASVVSIAFDRSTSLAQRAHLASATIDSVAAHPNVLRFPSGVPVPPTNSTVHSVVSTSAAPSIQAARDLFRQKTSELARANPVTADHAYTLLKPDSLPNGAGSSRAARNSRSLAPAMRNSSTLAQVRRQLADSAQLQRFAARTLPAEEMKVNSGDSAVPSLDFSGLQQTSRASSAGTSRRAESTLLKTTGFATWRPTSSLGSRPATATLSSSATPWQVARFERHARRDAQDTARQEANAARLMAAERERIQQMDASLKHAPSSSSSSRVSAYDLVLQHVSNLSAAGIGGSETRSTAASSPPLLAHSQLVSQAHLLDKSVHHPLQRLKIKAATTQRWRERQQQLQNMVNSVATATVHEQKTNGVTDDTARVE